MLCGGAVDVVMVFPAGPVGCPGEGRGPDGGWDHSSSFIIAFP